MKTHQWKLHLSSAILKGAPFHPICSWARGPSCGKSNWPTPPKCPRINHHHPLILLAISLGPLRFPMKKTQGSEDNTVSPTKWLCLFHAKGRCICAWFWLILMYMLKAWKDVYVDYNFCNDVAWFIHVYCILGVNTYNFYLMAFWIPKTNIEIFSADSTSWYLSTILIFRENSGW